MTTNLQNMPLGGRLIQEVGKITIENPCIDWVDIGLVATRRETPIKIYGKLEDGSDFVLTILALSTQLDTYETHDKNKVCCFNEWRSMS